MGANGVNENNGKSSVKNPCCDQWWGELTQVQRMWLHSHLWDLDILAGWTSGIVLGALESLHSQQADRYTPTSANGH